jgi:Transposase, Mutator family
MWVLYSALAVVRAYARRAGHVDRMILACFVLGLSTRKVAVALAPILGRRISAGTVSRVTKTLDAAVAAFHRRPLDDIYPVLMLDGVVLARKTGAGAVRRPVLVALGLRPDGKKEIIDYRLAVAESAAQWELYRRYLKSSGTGRFTVDRDKVETDAKFDGIFVLRTNIALDPLTVMRRYKQLWTVEQVFRTTKDILGTRPIFHKRDETIRGHMFCSFLALVLKKDLTDRLAAHRGKLEWADILADLDRVQEVELIHQGKRVPSSFWATTAPSREQLHPSSEMQHFGRFTVEHCREAGGHTIGGRLDRVRGKVGVTGRGANLGVPQELADHG